MNLPYHSRIVEANSECLIIDTLKPYANSLANRVAIIWDDPDHHDERILAVLTSIYYRDFRLRENLLGLFQHGGIITAWFAHGFDTDLVKQRRNVQIAADNAVRPTARWRVAQLETVSMDGDFIYAEALEKDHTLYDITSQFCLGTVRS